MLLPASPPEEVTMPEGAFISYFEVIEEKVESFLPPAASRLLVTELEGVLQMFRSGCIGVKSSIKH